MSERTIYRDIRDLMASGVPIEGEAGVGYVLKAGFDLPPLMFKEQEIEALVLGARIVEVLGGRGAGRGRDRCHRQDRGGDTRSAARLHGQHRAAGAAVPLHGADVVRSRRAAPRRPQPAQGAVPLHRRARAERASARCGRCRSPIFGPVWMLAAWCELREDFRTFRLDRIEGFAVTDRALPAPSAARRCTTS